MRPDHRGWAAWLFTLILVSTVLALSGVQPNDITEIDAAAPGWDPGRLLDDQYYREIDAWALDNGAAEGVGRWARYQVDYRLFNDSTSPSLVVGDNGVVFFRPLINRPCTETDPISYPELNPATAGDLIVFAVTLPKAHFLRDQMPAHERPDECTANSRAALLERVGEDPRNLDLATLIAEDPAGNLSVTEPGWSAAGRALAARAIVDRFQPGLWDPDATIETSREIVPVFGQLLGSTASVTVDDLTIDRAAEITVVAEREAFGLTAFRHTQAADVDVVPGTTYFIGDRETIDLLPLLTPYFEELIFTSWVGVALAPLDVDVLPPPNRLVVQVTELGAIENLANPLLPEIADALLPLAN